jgi:hypothetical protein
MTPWLLWFQKEEEEEEANIQFLIQFQSQLQNKNGC